MRTEAVPTLSGIDDCQFLNNSASDQYQSLRGGLHWRTDGNKLLFRGNTAPSGGAISHSGPTKATTVPENRATRGVEEESSASASLAMTATTFEDNEANTNGGATYPARNVDLSTCTSRTTSQAVTGAESPAVPTPDPVLPDDFDRTFIGNSAIGNGGLLDIAAIRGDLQPDPRTAPCGNQADAGGPLQQRRSDHPCQPPSAEPRPGPERIHRRRRQLHSVCGDSDEDGTLDCNDQFDDPLKIDPGSADAASRIPTPTSTAPTARTR